MIKRWLTSPLLFGMLNITEISVVICFFHGGQFVRYPGKERELNKRQKEGVR